MIWLWIIAAVLTALLVIVPVAVAVVILRATGLPSTPAEPSDFGTDQFGKGAGALNHGGTDSRD